MPAVPTKNCRSAPADRATILGPSLPDQIQYSPIDNANGVLLEGLIVGESAKRCIILRPFASAPTRRLVARTYDFRDRFLDD